MAKSAFWQEVESIRKMPLDGANLEEFKQQFQEIISSLEDLQGNTQQSYDNLPEGLQNSSKGELIQGRADATQTVIDDLQEHDPEELESATDEEISNKQAEVRQVLNDGWEDCE